MGVSDSVMWWISLFIPVLAFVLGAGLQFWIKRAWVGTLLVFGGSYIALYAWFSLKFWSWLLLYLMLDWLGAWVAVNVQKWRKQRRSTPVAE